jgi:hypothetical protein
MDLTTIGKAQRVLPSKDSSMQVFREGLGTTLS